MSDYVTVAQLPPDFDDWDGLLALIRRAFAYMDGVIDPPSSVHLLTPELLCDKARAETIFLAFQGQRLVGCVALNDRGDCLYLGKLAVDPDVQGHGIGRRRLDAAEQFACAQGRRMIELQTRVELSGNHKTFARLGFVETGSSAHAGYDRPTSITMRKSLA
ncbi:GNAT family N-acetyltransferase [Mesorhizobium sp. IMUNJ 23232]|uniref:GNAT family N-acetyltransferase n=1 Tax=Mesorhizobium sp. IMUNJ 23232 TaxID=3376064 RepID=UPI00379C1148